MKSFNLLCYWRFLMALSLGLFSMFRVSGKVNYIKLRMASKFLAKYKMSSSINSGVRNFELLHPINKSIKASQIYQDTDLSIYTESSKARMSSQPPRISSSIILEPIQHSPKHNSYFKSFSGQEDYDPDKDALKFYTDSPRSPRKSPEKRQVHSKKIRSPRNMFNIH